VPTSDAYCLKICGIGIFQQREKARKKRVGDAILKIPYDILARKIRDGYLSTVSAATSRKRVPRRPRLKMGRLRSVQARTGSSSGSHAPRMLRPSTQATAAYQETMARDERISFPFFFMVFFLSTAG
jgi:hypothetical protein